MHLLGYVVAIVLAGSSHAASAQVVEAGTFGGDAAPTRLAPIVSEIRLHGNHTTPDDEILKLAALVPGQRIEPDGIEAALQRLRTSGRFSDVEIRQRSRSLADAGPVALIILVTERAAIVAVDTGLPPIPGPLSRLRHQTMFLPIVRFDDGYGLTYGARTAIVGGQRSSTRLSVPATWGGTRRVALEAEHGITRPRLRLAGSVGIWRQEHPFYREGEVRRVAALEISHRVRPLLGVGVLGSVSGVSFGGVNDRMTSGGVFAELDTRVDPLFPRNAVHARTQWSRVAFRNVPGSGDPRSGAPESGSRVRSRWRHDIRGYVGVWRQIVLAGRAQLDLTDGRLPAYEQRLLGGAGSLRGFRAGSFVGDNLVAGTVEVRAPFTSPLRLWSLGGSVFHDIGRTYDHGERFRDGRLDRGVGAGVFLLTPIVQLQVSVARGIDRGTRAHVSSGVSWEMKE